MTFRLPPTCLLLMGFTLALPLGAAPKSVSSRPAPERDYRLFVGIEVQVRVGDEMVNVADFDRTKLKLAGSSIGELSLQEAREITYVHATKLGRAPIVLGEIDTDRIVDTSANVMENLRNQAGMQTYAADRADFAIVEEVAVIQLNQAIASTPAPGGPGGGVELERPQNSQTLASRETNPSQLGDSAFYADRLTDVGDRKPDTLKISTTLTSAHEVRDAYLVGVARVRDQEGEVMDSLIFKDIPLLDETPRLIEAQRTGLPEDFELLGVNLHVYHQGQELTTSESDKQFALTREEAIEYLTLERVAENRGKSLPPSPAWALAPPELLAHDNPDHLDFPMMVDVDARGQVTHLDAGNQIVPEHIADIVKDLLFYPALEGGATVAGKAEVNLRDYFN